MWEFVGVLGGAWVGGWDGVGVGDVGDIEVAGNLYGPDD